MSLIRPAVLCLYLSLSLSLSHTHTHTHKHTQTDGQSVLVALCRVVNILEMGVSGWK